MTHRHKVHVMRRRQTRESVRLRERALRQGLSLERRVLRAPADGPLEDERGVVYLPETGATAEHETPPPAAA
jgi:hypothetical protein